MSTFNKLGTFSAACMLAATLGAPATAVAHDADAADAPRKVERTLKDAWIDGKLEAVYSLNEHLNPFTIDTEVSSGVVRLSGTVENTVERDLAGELAKGVDGVHEVINDLAVDTSVETSRDGAERDFGAWANDVTITAKVKSKLLANEHTRGLDIDVDTKHRVVKLNGAVESDEARQLAEQITRNTGNVRDVHNHLHVN